MRAAQARALIGARMRELRQCGGISLGKVAELSGWNKGHLSRVESGFTKPSLELVEWYDGQFGARGALINQFVAVTDSVRTDRQRTLRDARRAPGVALVAGGSVPADHDDGDGCALVDETVPDGSWIGPGALVRKSWTLRNAGSAVWRDRWLSRQGTPGVPGWPRSPARVPVARTAPGERVTVTVEVVAPATTGACVAYFTLTDAEGRPYFPDSSVRPLHCTLYVGE